MDWYEVIKYLLFTVFLAIAAYTDMRYRRINNLLMLAMFAVGIIVTLLSRDIGVYILALIGAVLAAVWFGIIYFTSKGGLGAGDVKLAICMGVFVGVFDFINIMIYSLIYTVIVGIVLAVIKRKSGNSKEKTRLPFAPFILLGNITNMAFMIFYLGG